MGIFAVGKKAAGQIVNLKVKDWLNSEQHKKYVSYIFNSYKSLFTSNIGSNNIQETFEQVMERLQLTEEDILQRKREFFKLFIISLLFSVLLFIYTMYITVKYQSIYGFVLGLSVSFLSLANVFKYHFWLKQITLRKLGLTFKEWLN